MYFLTLHLLLWLSKNGKKSPWEIREEVWGLNYALTDAFDASTKTGICLAWKLLLIYCQRIIIKS